MRIPFITIDLTDNDLIILVNKFTNSKKVIITSVKLSEQININGILVFKGLKLSFLCELIIESISINTINIKINNFKVINMTLPSPLKDLATKSFLSSIETEGIHVLENLVTIDLKELLLQLNISNIEIKSLKVSNHNISLTLQNIYSNKSLDELITMVI